MKTLAHSTDKTEILRRIEALRPERAASWGTMSAHQMVCHVNDCFRMAVERKSVNPSSGFYQRTILKWIALYAPMRWPTGIQTMPEVDQTREGTRPGDFADDMAQLVELVERFTAETQLDGLSHPIFGRMSEAAWLRWAYLHTDHHLRQFGV